MSASSFRCRSGLVHHPKWTKGFFKGFFFAAGDPAPLARDNIMGLPNLVCQSPNQWNQGSGVALLCKDRTADPHPSIFTAEFPFDLKGKIPFAIFTRQNRQTPSPPLSLHCKDRAFPSNFDGNPKIWVKLIGPKAHLRKKEAAVKT